MSDRTLVTIIATALAAAPISAAAQNDASPPVSSPVPSQSPAAAPETGPTATGPAVAYVTRTYKPKLGVMTMGQGLAIGLGAALSGIAVAAAAGGAGGALDAAEQGPKPLSADVLADPASSVGEQLATVLAQKKGGHVASPPISLEKNQPVPVANGRDYLVDVETRGWMVSYLPTKWSRYKLTYQMQLRVRDGVTGKELLKQGCTTSPKLDQAPTYREMAEQGAAKLNDMVATAANACLEQFRAKLGAL